MAAKKNFVLRISEEVFKELESWAAQEFRSVNGQIEYLISQALQERKGKSKKENQAPTPDEK